MNEDVKEMQSFVEKTDSAEPAADEKKLPECYYDSQRKDYLFKNNRGEFLRGNESAIRTLLKQARLSPCCPKNEAGALLAFTSPVEDRMAFIREHCDVAYAGPVGGKMPGCYVTNGGRVLVTTGPVIIRGKVGKWPTLKQLFQGMLAPDKRQLDYFYGWLKIAREGLLAGQRTPGQFVWFLGPRDCGKSLLQKLITELLGGREARPYRYMAGKTDFNRDLVGAEHQVIEDDQPHRDLAGRREFGVKTKEWTVNNLVSCHGKGLEAIALAPFWRSTGSANDEPENLGILPILDESIIDKLILFKVQRPDAALPETTAARYAFWECLVAELPAFIHYLEKWSIPPDIADSRFGVKAFHHPSIIQAIDGLSPEVQMLDLIDKEVFGVIGQRDAWSGCAAELERLLKRMGNHDESSSSVRAQADKLLPTTNVVGNYLARLAKKHPDRVAVRRLHAPTLYEIQPPTEAAF